MARLHEYQGKTLLAQAGFAIPRGGPASTPADAAAVASRIGGPVVIKIQAWTTGRAAIGGVAFADTPEQAAEHARRMLAMKVGNFPITQVLVEEKLAIAHELFVSLSIDDKARKPVILLSLAGGSGIEERALGGGGKQIHRLECDVHKGVDAAALDRILAVSSIPPAPPGVRTGVREAVQRVFTVARTHEARSVEINPLVITKESAAGPARIVAADCRITIDDYAVFRHPDLGIDIARELDHPPTALERIAYDIEQSDHRGTFYFAQMNWVSRLSEPTGQTSRVDRLSEPTVSPPTRLGEPGYPEPNYPNLIGFHGAGGGGSMMSMDAITAVGMTLANFCDTSGNPSPAKVYRAARVILQQPGLVGYFGSGSGVANQEQYWSAYGLAKAFWEMDLDIPAVIRLGGNTEDRAADILHGACKAAGLRAPVEVYKKSDSPAKIAARFAELVASSQGSGATDGGSAPSVPGGGGKSVSGVWQPRPPRRPSFVGAKSAISFPVKGGTVWIDSALWRKNAAAIIARAGGLLKDDKSGGGGGGGGGGPALTVSPAEFLTRDSDMIACEVECRRDGVQGLFVVLDIPGLD